MTRDELKAEISNRIDSIVDSNRRLEEEDINQLVDELGPFVEDILEEDEQSEEEPDEEGAEA